MKLRPRAPPFLGLVQRLESEGERAQARADELHKRVEGELRRERHEAEAFLRDGPARAGDLDGDGFAEDRDGDGRRDAALLEPGAGGLDDAGSGMKLRPPSLSQGSTTRSTTTAGASRSGGTRARSRPSTATTTSTSSATRSRARSRGRATRSSPSSRS